MIYFIGKLNLMSLVKHFIQTQTDKKESLKIRLQSYESKMSSNPHIQTIIVLMNNSDKRDSVYCVHNTPNRMEELTGMIILKSRTKRQVDYGHERQHSAWGTEQKLQLS